MIVDETLRHVLQTSYILYHEYRWGLEVKKKTVDMYEFIKLFFEKDDSLEKIDYSLILNEKSREKTDKLSSCFPNFFFLLHWLERMYAWTDS